MVFKQWMVLLLLVNRVYQITGTDPCGTTVTPFNSGLTDILFLVDGTSDMSATTLSHQNFNNFKILINTYISSFTSDFRSTGTDFAIATVYGTSVRIEVDFNDASIVDTAGLSTEISAITSDPSGYNAISLDSSYDNILDSYSTPLSFSSSGISPRLFTNKVIILLLDDNLDTSSGMNTDLIQSARDRGILVLAVRPAAASIDSILMTYTGNADWIFDLPSSTADYITLVQTLRRLISTCTINCGPPPQILDGVVNYDTTLFQSSANYSCLRGFELNITTSTVCQGDGTWSPLPGCDIITCPALATISGAELFDGGTEYLAVSEYRCVAGWELTSGDLIRVCQQNGTWSGDQPVCSMKTCDVLSVPNGMATYDDNQNVGSNATIQCDSGYTLEGPSMLTCQEDETWSRSGFACVVTDCGLPDGVKDGTYTITGTTFGSSVQYMCRDGYTLEGPSTASCEAIGWDAGPPTCTIVNCTTPPIVNNADMEYLCTTFGCLAMYTCAEGYSTNDVPYAICGSDMNWSGADEITCNEVDCGTLSEPQNGALTLGSTTYLGTATYTCDTGFVLEGSSSRNCTRFGKWSGRDPTCLAIDCGAPTEIVNGIVRNEGSGNNDGTEYPHLSTYTCNRGFELPGTTMGMCMLNGEWSRPIPLTCTRVNCMMLPDLENGDIVYPFDTYYQSVAYHSCNEGYELNGAALRVCEENGEWSSSTPICQPIDCGSPGNLDNGIITPGDNTSLGATVTFTCNSGYTLQGMNSRTCQSNGRWNNEVPVCQANDCGLHGPVENGDVVYTAGTTFGSMAHFSCNTGFQLMGAPSVLMCLEDDWSSAVQPTCQAVDCGTPPPRMYANYMVLNDTTYQCVAEYKCQRGYRMSGGDEFIQCLSNGVWSPATIDCEIIDCGEPALFRNGQVEVNETTFGASIIYTCDPGYQVMGDPTRECTQPNYDGPGMWVGDPPYCQIVDCGPVSDVANGDVVYSSGTTFGSTATHVCNHGYTLMGSSTRVCQQDGTWTGVTANCAVIQCSPLVSPMFGVVDMSRGRDYVAVAHYRCNDGYSLNGQSVRQCEVDGEWSGGEPTCTEVDCGSLSDIQYGSVNYSSTLLGATATYECDLGFSPSEGTTTRNCVENGKWDGYELQCQPVQCSPFDISDGDISYSNGLNYLSISVITCNSGFMLSGPDTSECQDDGTWNVTSTTCQRILCGTPPVSSMFTLLANESGAPIAEYYCGEGLYLYGPRFTVCLENGSWSGPPPVCRFAECGVLEIPENGNITYITNNVFASNEDPTEFGAVVQYSCDDGYIVRGSTNSTPSHQNLRSCSFGSTPNSPKARWIPAGIEPYCERVDCGYLGAIQNGDLQYMDDTRFGSYAVYTCNDGYLLEGSGQLRCNVMGQWTDQPPTCTIADCGPLNTPTNGSLVTSNDTTYKAIALYGCDTGFTLKGCALRTCTYNSSRSSIEWSEAEPYCEIVDCGLPEAPVSGNINNSSGTVYQSVLLYNCDDGHTLIGSASRTCQADGSWYPPEDPTCAANNCTDLAPVENTFEMFTNGSMLGSRVKYTCVNGTELVGGSEIRECLVDGNWSGTPPLCVVPQPPPDLSVQVVNSSGESTLFLVEFTHHLDFARECELVYFKTSSGADTQGGLASLPGEFVPQGDTMTVLLSENQTSVYVRVNEAGSYEFSVRCNSSVGMTGFSAPVSGEAPTAASECNDVFSCNPQLLYSVIVPVAVVITVLITVVAVVVAIKLGRSAKSTPSPNPPAERVDPENEHRTTVLAGPAAAELEPEDPQGDVPAEEKPEGDTEPKLESED